MPPAFAAPDAAALPLHPVAKGGLDTIADPRARAWAEACGFTGALGEALVLPDPDGGIAGALAGLGDPAAHAPGGFRLAACAAKLPPGAWRLAGPLADAGTEALGWLLGAYRYDRHKPSKAAPRLLVAPEGVDAPRIEAIAAAVAAGRDLVNAPAAELGPAALAEAALALAAAHGAEAEVIGGAALAERFPLIAAVGRAAAEAPRLIDLRWGDPGDPLVTVVGKGVCFDTGGLDIKPSAAMRLMKKDMGGAAAALTLARLAMGAGLRVRLRVLIPAVENAIGAGAFRPGDILRSRKGLTVEVANTDAEGRLILADAMALACEEAPALLLDFATLTGAARVALGPELPALFTDDDALAEGLLSAGARVADPLWRLPLWRGYEGDLETPVADLDNAPTGGFAGAITAALFLRRFAEGARSWAHVDLMAWTPKARPGRPMGGEIQAARAAFELLEARHGRRG